MNIPIGLFLLFLTGVGPLFAWRRSSVESLKRAFLWPTIAAVCPDGRAVRSFRHPALLRADVVRRSACLWPGRSLASSTKARRRSRQEPDRTCVAATVELTHRNTRRYGGYLVHMGIVIMFIGFTGTAFNKDTTVKSAWVRSFSSARYEMKVREIVERRERQLRLAARATIEYLRTAVRS